MHSGKKISGGILWLHRVVEIEPNSSSHRTVLPRCLSRISESRRALLFCLIARTDERAVAGVVPLSSRPGSRRKQLASAAASKPIVSDDAAALILAVPAQADNGSTLTDD